MKKTYQKPSIYVEYFELDTAIASCGVGANGGSDLGKPHQGSPDTCHFGTTEDAGMFSDLPTSPCAKDKDDWIDEVPKDADGTMYCYHQPDGTIKVFAS